mmetsp:Transcript_127585/g.284566  ORF Transcript_127585/g.284566 Transcript_127585/m.284566 type:complete len:286 (-) Transcript_127585:64-921(-)
MAANPSQGVVLSGDSGISVGRPVASDQGGSDRGSGGASEERTFVNGSLLDFDRNLIEYPPGEVPVVDYMKPNLETVSPESLVWVMVIVLGKLTFWGQQAVRDALKAEVLYGDPSNRAQSLTLSLKSREVRAKEGTTSLDLDSVLAIPWKTDVTPRLSLRIYRAGKMMGFRLPFTLSPSHWRQVLGEVSMTLPFQLQRPRKIMQEIVLQVPKANAIFGSVEFAVDFKQIQLGRLKNGGEEMATALLEDPDRDLILDAGPMTALPASLPFVLGQPLGEQEQAAHDRA